MKVYVPLCFFPCQACFTPPPRLTFESGESVSRWENPRTLILALGRVTVTLSVPGLSPPLPAASERPADLGPGVLRSRAAVLSLHPLRYDRGQVKPKS